VKCNSDNYVKNQRYNIVNISECCTIYTTYIQLYKMIKKIFSLLGIKWYVHLNRDNTIDILIDSVKLQTKFVWSLFGCTYYIFKMITVFECVDLSQSIP